MHYEIIFGIQLTHFKSNKRYRNTQKIQGNFTKISNTLFENKILVNYENCLQILSQLFKLEPKGDFIGATLTSELERSQVKPITVPINHFFIVSTIIR